MKKIVAFMMLAGLGTTLSAQYMIIGKDSISLADFKKEYQYGLQNAGITKTIKATEDFILLVYMELMGKHLQNWDIERLAATDTALIVMGIAEAVEFQDIPVKVTINEYVELSKYFSTPNSKVFVNGILDKVIASLMKDGQIEKRGRGLVGSSE